MHVDVAGEKLILLPEKALFWPAQQTLIIADLHLGKISHFRKAGLPVPLLAAESNWKRFRELLDTHQPSEVILLGDLFHSDENQEWAVFREIIRDVARVRIHLILGNHDILDEQTYQEANLILHTTLTCGPFLCSHYPLEEVSTGFYNLCGHVHPGFRLRGRARQSLRLPCFAFYREIGMLPAFGAFTGMALVKATNGSRIYVIVGDKIMRAK